MRLRNLAAFVAALFFATNTASFAATGSTSSALASVTHTFTSNGSDTVPTWATGAYFTYCGGGGGGGGGTVGAGGGSAACWLDLFEPVTPGATLTITIGAAGTGGSTGVNGVAGGNTTITGAVATLPVACGGGLGVTSGASNGGAGGGACVGGGGGFISNPTNGPTIGTFFPGQNGSFNGGAVSCFAFDGTSFSNAAGGSGGCGPFGKGGVAGAIGAAATGFGAAGGGGGTTTGGNGTPGIAIIRYTQ